MLAERFLQLRERPRHTTVLGDECLRGRLAPESENARRAAVEMQLARLFAGVQQDMIAHTQIDVASYNRSRFLG